MHFVKSSFNFFYNELHSTVSRSLLFFDYTFSLRNQFVCVCIYVWFVLYFCRWNETKHKKSSIFRFGRFAHSCYSPQALLFIIKRKDTEWKTRRGFFFSSFFPCFIFLTISNAVLVVCPFIAVVPYAFSLSLRKVSSFVVLDRWSCTLVFTCFLLFFRLHSFSFSHCRRCSSFQFSTHTFTLSLSRPLSAQFEICYDKRNKTECPTTLYIVDNVCLFCVRAFTSKIQNTFFRQTTWETYWPLNCFYSNFFFLYSIALLRKTMPVKWVGWIKCSACQTKTDDKLCLWSAFCL